MDIIQVRKNIETLEQDRKNLVDAYEKELRAKDNEIRKAKEVLAMCLNGVVVERIENAKRFIFIENPKRYGPGESENAMRTVETILTNCPKELTKKYVGCKDYDRFVCQEESHRYGYGPTHGNIVWSIGATKEWRNGEIDPEREDVNDMLYYLNIFKNPYIRKEIYG